MLKTILQPFLQPLAAFSILSSLCHQQCFQPLTFEASVLGFFLAKYAKKHGQKTTKNVQASHTHR